MNKSKWLVVAAALGMIAATGGYLVKAHQHMRLGQPGVKVGPGLLYNEDGILVARQCVTLPKRVLGMEGRDLPVTQVEVDVLPKDTTFGRKFYSEGHFSVMTSVVLMGADRTSIHQPQYCLVAQGWHIDKTEQVLLAMDAPYSYEVPALKLTATRQEKTKLGDVVEVRGIYIYWFVSGDRLASDVGTRMWSIAKTMLEKGVLERWAYITYFSICPPGLEDATYQRLKRFIRQSAPEFQTVAGQPAPRPPVATR